MVTDEERDYMYTEYAKDPRMRINVGIRRRLAPLHGQRPAPDRAAEQPAVQLPGTPDHLLRRRDRHGRQHLPRRPQRRAHADAVDRRPQRRLLARRRARALRAGDHRPGLRLPGGQRRGAASASRLAAQLDEAADPRSASATRSSAAARSSSCTRRTGASWPTCASTRATSILCVDNLSRFVQPVELDLRQFEGWVPVELIGRDALPADRRAAVLPDARAARLLLVRADRCGALSRRCASEAAQIPSIRVGGMAARRKPVRFPVFGSNRSIQVRDWARSADLTRRMGCWLAQPPPHRHRRACWAG